MFNPKGVLLTFDFPQISKEIESNAHVHQVAISPISRFLKGHFTCAKISTVEYRFFVLGLVCSAGVFWAAESCLFMFVLLFFDSPHFLPSFRVLTCAFAIKTFARPKKTPALQVNLGLRIRMGQERLSPGETSQAKRSEEKRLFSIQKLSLKYFFFSWMVKKRKNYRCHTIKKMENSFVSKVSLGLRNRVLEQSGFP